MSAIVHLPSSIIYMYTFLFDALATPEPPPPAELAGLPLEVWTNLPFLICGVFAIAFLIGALFILRENRRVAARRARADAANPFSSE
ncbi:MAG: hypothetical protein HUU23_02835 [Caldilineales bacterium]|nr:hypothetical protein [Caldilineales bacterium]